MKAGGNLKIILALLIFSAVVLFHELGHFLLARKNGKPVDKIKQRADKLIEDFMFDPNNIVWLRASEIFKGQYSVSHSRNTAEMAKRISAEMGLNEKTKDLIYYAGLLQNIGKITLPEELFATKGKLSKEDWEKLKNYSSGMQVRLAFSVAIKAQGDVLILDEVLAVGDEAFQRKCNDYFMERKESGKTTILVTHDMGAVKKYCNRAVLIEKGLVKAYGNPFDVANQYSYDNTEKEYDDNVQEEREVKEDDKISDISINLLSEKRLTPKDEISFEVNYNMLQDMDTYVALSFTDIDRNIWIYNDNSKEHMTTGAGKKNVKYSCHIPNVNDLKLKLEVTIRDKDGQMIGFVPAEKSPIILLTRDDLDYNNESEVDSATGLIQRNGQWDF